MAVSGGFRIGSDRVFGSDRIGFSVAILAQVRSAMWPALEAGSSAEDAMACARGRARASAALFDRWSKGRSAGVHLACASVMVGLLSTVGTAA